MIKQRGRKWRVVVQAGREPVTGKRRQLSGSARNEREALRLERQLRLQAQAGVVGTITLRALVVDWLAGDPPLAPTTLSNYRRNLENHILPFLGDKRVEQIRPRLVAQFLAHLQDKAKGKGLGPATVRKVRTVLSAVMSYAVAMEYAESNPGMKVPPPKLPPSKRVAPTVEEAARLLLCAEDSDEDFLDYLWVSAEEGGRRGETLDLRWDGVDLKGSRLTFQGVVSIGDDGCHSRPDTKTGEERTIGISSVTVARLGARKERIDAMLSAAAGKEVTVAPDAYVFSGGRGSRRHPLDGKLWRPDTTSRRFRRLKERAGVRPEIDLHGLRRAMMTEPLVAGVDPHTVMGRGGHRHEGMTLKIYAKVRPAVDAAAAELWGRILDEKLRELRQEDEKVTPIREGVRVQGSSEGCNGADGEEVTALVS